MDEGSCEDGHNGVGVLMALTEHITKGKGDFPFPHKHHISLNIHIMSIRFLGTSSPINIMTLSQELPSQQTQLIGAEP